MNFVCKHDAPGGTQDPNTFKRLYKNSRVRICWLFPDVELITKIKSDRRFYEKNQFIQKINIEELKEFIKKNLSLNGKQTMVNHFGATHFNDDKVLNMKNGCLQQFWRDLSLPIGTIMYIRGKSGKLNEGCLVQIISSEIEFIPKSEYDYVDCDYPYVMCRNVNVIGKVSTTTYERIQGIRRSIWNIKTKDEKELLAREFDKLTKTIRE